MQLLRSRPSLVRVVVLPLVALLAAGLACGGSEKATGPETPPSPPLVVTLTAPTTASATVLEGVGRCSVPLAAAAAGGDAGASAQWTGGTLTWTAIATQQTVTEELTADQVAAWFQSSTVPTGQTRTAQRTVSRDRAFRVRHELRYRADAVTKTVAHDLTCDFPPVASLTATPDAVTLRVGESRQLAATPKDSTAKELTGRLVAWSTSDAAVATVTATGLVAGVKAGTATITGTSEGKAVTVAVVVLTPVANVTITPLPARVSMGRTSTLAAVLRSASGDTLRDRVVTWATGSGAIATISSAGVVTGIALGTTTVTATSEGQSVAVPLSVVQPIASVTVEPSAASVVVGKSVALTATPRNAGGTPMDRLVTWAAADSTIAKVSVGGTVTGVTAGTTTVTATSDGISTTVKITVLPGVATVKVAPDSARLVVGGTVMLAASLADSSGAVLTGRSVSWASSDSGVASVSGAGVILARAAGTATITATSEGKSGTALIRVVAPVASLTLAPSPASVPAGQTLALTATMRDAAGTVLTDRTVAWSSGAPAIATVDTLGVVTGVSAGVARITAASDGRSATLDVAILPAVAAVSVSPDPASVQVGDFVALSAALTDAAAKPLTGRRVAWTTRDASVATVDTAGAVTGVTVGTTTVVATSEGKSDSAQVTVAVRRPVSTIALTAPASYVPVGAAAPIGIVVRDASGSVLNGRAVTWATSSAAVATVSAAGVVTGVALGAVTITATSEGKSATVRLDVVAPAATVTLAPTTSSILPGATVTLRATVRDASGAALTGRKLLWSVSDTTRARLSAGASADERVVTALALGLVVVTVNVEEIGATAQVAVVPPVAAVAVSPNPARVSQGATLALEAALTDANGLPLGGRTIAWSTSNAAVATVSAAGVVSGVALGTVTITATSEGKSGATTVTVSRPVSSVTVTPAASSVPVGTPVSLTATLKDVTGAVLSSGAVSWSSSNPAVATVSATGSVQTLAVGTATITATSEGKSGTATVTTFEPVAQVTVTPTSKKIAVQQKYPLDVFLGDRNGGPISGRVVTWTSSDPSVATVSASGEVTGLKLGATTITATAEGVAGSAEIMVHVPVSEVLMSASPSLQVGGTATMTATPYGETSPGVLGPLTGREATLWYSSDPAVATVSPSGEVRAVGAGMATIVATIEDVSGRGWVDVAPLPLATVSVSPATLTLPMDQHPVLGVVLRDAAGKTLTTTSTITWTSSAPTILAVDARGQIYPQGKAGTATITATVDGKSGTATVTIPPVGAVATVSLSPANPVVSVGKQLSVYLHAEDANGVAIQGDATLVRTYTSSNPAVATIDANGIVTGIAIGTTTITGSLGGKSTSTQLGVVAQGTIGSYYIDPSAFSLMPGLTRQIYVRTLDPMGQPMTGIVSTLSSSNPAVATVSQSGLVTALSAGTATITATREGRTATATVTVGRAPVYSVTVLPAQVTALVGETRQLEAVVRDNTNRVVTDRLVSWSSSDPAVATVSATGLVTTRSLGYAMISAQSEGEQDFASYTVVSALAPVASVEVTPRDVRMNNTGATQQLTAVVKDAGGLTLGGRAPAWSSSNPAVASVSASGLVTGVGTGSAEVRATIDGRSDTSYVVVGQWPIFNLQIIGANEIRINESVAFQPLINNEAGNLIDPKTRTITWRSTNPGVASVDASGVVTGRAAGLAEIYASSEGFTSLPFGVQVVTIDDPVVTVQITPTSAKVLLDSIVPLRAAYVTASGRQGYAGFTWTSSDPTIASVPANGGTYDWYGELLGPVTGHRLGTVTITATIGGKSASAQVSVVPPEPVATISVAPNPLTVPVNDGERLIATLKDAAGRVLSGRDVTWSVANATVANVDQTGWVNGRTIGTTTVTATSEGKSATVTVNVVASQPAVASVTVTPNPANVVKGGTLQLTATVRDATGAVLAGRTVSWSTGSNAIATVSGTGVLSGIAAGTTTVTAYSGGKSGTATVNVTAGSTGGGGTGSVCSSLTSTTAPARGTSSAWLPTQFKGLDYQVRAGSVDYDSGPGVKLQYFVKFRNHYTQKIWYSMSGPLPVAPTSTISSQSLAPGAEGGGNNEYFAPPSKVYVLVNGLRFGDWLAPATCE